MPTENRSSNTEMVSVPSEQLQAWQERFSKAQIFRESSEVQALLNQPAKHQGEPVALPTYRRDRKHNSHDWDEGHMEGWAECFEEFTKLGPLYTRSN